jgi:hypothetical protein
MFNEGRYYERVQAGLIIERVAVDFHPSQTAAHEPLCTLSQLVDYIDLAEGRKVAQVHQYLRTDGTLGASGLPDPKTICIDQIIYELDETAYEFDR